MNSLEDPESVKQTLGTKSFEWEMKSSPGSKAPVVFDTNHKRTFRVKQDQTIAKVNGDNRAKQRQHLKSEPTENGSTEGHLGPESQSTHINEETKKTGTWSVFQRKPKQPRAVSYERPSPVQMNPAVNRPQVLAPSESVRMRGLKEATECAFAWTRPSSPPPPAGQPSHVASSHASSTITDLLSKSTLMAQSSVNTRDASTSQGTQSKGFEFGLISSLSTKRFSALEGTRTEGKPTKTTTDQANKSQSILMGHSSSGTAIGERGGTLMSELLRLGRAGGGGSGGGGKGESDEGKRRRSSIGPNEFLKMYRSRTDSDPRRLSEPSITAARAQHRRYNSESQTTFSIFNGDLEELDVGTTVSNEKKQKPQSLPKRKSSQNILMDLPNTIHEHKEMPSSGFSRSLPSSHLFVASNTENQYPITTSSSSFLSSSSCSAAAGNNATDRRNRRTRMMDRRFSEPPMLSLQKMSSLRICYAKTTLGQWRDESDSQNSIHSSNHSISSVAPISPTRSTNFSISPESLGIDSPFISRQHLVVWRDQQSTQILKLPAAVEYHDTLQDIIDEDDSLIYSELMRLHTCWELVPNSSTVVALDIELKVVCAFQAFIVHGISAAILWHSEQRKFVGMLTVTDFIRVLQKHRHSREGLERIKDDKISHWKEELLGEGVDCRGGLTSVGPDDSLYDVICRLHSSGFHRLPVIDALSNNVLYTIGYRRILQFICLFVNNLPLPDFMNKTIWELQVGTFDDVVSVRQEQPLYEALDSLVGRRLSALPVVDSADKVVNIYCKTDALELAANESYNNLSVTIGEILSTERESFEGVFLCGKNDSLSHVVEWFVRTNVHRLIVVDDDRRLQGVVSLSDVVRFLVLHPPKKDVQMEGCETIVPEHHRMETTQF